MTTILNTSHNGHAIDMANSIRLREELNRIFEKNPSSLEPIRITVGTQKPTIVKNK